MMPIKCSDRCVVRSGDEAPCSGSRSCTAIGKSWRKCLEAKQQTRLREVCRKSFKSREDFISRNMLKSELKSQDGCGNRWLTTKAVACLLMVALCQAAYASESNRWSDTTRATLTKTTTTTRYPAGQSSFASTSEQPKASIDSPSSDSIIKNIEHVPAAGVCQVSAGESVAILEIEESRGSDMSQSTSPMELPISGSVQRGEIELKIESETHKYFQIHDKRLRLARPLDRDATLKQNSTQSTTQPISSIYLQISCLDKRQVAKPKQPKKVIIPVLVKVLDLNDNAPKFSQPSYTINVDELTPVDSIVLDQIQAIDLDSANNGQVEYQLFDLTAAPSSSANKQLENLVKEQASSTRAPAITTTTTSTRPQVDQLIAKGTSSDINLNSEPIINGPMDDSDEEESDEALLASMNSTEPLDPEPDGLVLMLANQQPASSKLQPNIRHKRRSDSWISSGFQQHLIQEENREKVEDGADGPSILLTTGRPTTITPLTKGQPLWTNLMSLIEEPLPVVRTQQRQPSEIFTLEFSSSNQRPVIKLQRALDYESQRVHQLLLVATDRATNKSERLSSSAVITVRVLDGDDQGPAFLLEQVGCATGSVTQTTASTISQPSGSPVATTATLIRRRRAPQASNQQPSHLPKGFKVTEENFDFSDVSGPSSSDTDDELGNHQLLSILRADAPVDQSAPGIHRSRRIPTRMGDKSSIAGAMQSDSNIIASGFTSGDERRPQAAYNCLPLPVSGGISSAGNTQAEYFATVMSGDFGQLVRVAPQAIKARDRDELNAPVRYSFVNGTPANYSLYFQINPLDASIKQVAPIASSGRFLLWVEAQEQTAKRLSNQAKLTIDVVASDKNPPVLIPNSYAGFVEENSPIGTQVLVAPPQINGTYRAAPMRINVLDPDEEQEQPSGSAPTYEFETTSDAFKVNKDGTIYVNKWPLDRDPPNQIVHMFQVTARRLGRLVSSRSLSSPISLNVTLLDLNDNAPQIANSSLAPVYIEANSNSLANHGHRLISVIRALDKDSGDNARVRFSIRHVSNGGRDRFRIGEDSGDLEALGKFHAGEQFSLTLEVSDELQRSAQGILEVNIVPGANQAGPQFIDDEPRSAGNVHHGIANKPSSPYSGGVIEISEAVAPDTLVHQLKATDPEGDPITYSILDGNVNNDFYISSKSGHIYVANQLDREEIGAYTLLVQARDSGGLASQRVLRVVVTDSNDQNPVFEQASYVFATPEGPVDEGGRLLGRVRAHDADSGDNGRVSYKLLSLPRDAADAEAITASSFSIDARTGELRLTRPLDYEKLQSHTLLVQATDHGQQPRTSSASILVRVLDTQDEVPYFERYHLEARVEENLAHHQLGQVRARDPDTVAQATYVIKQGDTSLFTIDPQTGVISTTAIGLDYEQAKKHTILVGTIENQELDLVQVAEELNRALQSGTNAQPPRRMPICRIDVIVSDINDNAPQFLESPMPVRVQDSAQLGQQVARLVARDLDSSAPNNQIRYEMIVADYATERDDSRSTYMASSKLMTSERCAKSFMVDAQSGSVSVRSDLRRDIHSECQLVIKARDLGQYPQQLSSAPITLAIFIDHVAEISTNSMLAFADGLFTVELEENSQPDQLVKILPVVNKPKVGSFPLSCEIVTGNELGKFYVLANEQRDCELRTAPIVSIDQYQKSNLDYEEKQRYQLKIRLNTIGSASLRPQAQVNVQLIDQNDNKPVYQNPTRYGQLTQGKFLAAVASDAPSESQVIQVRATDRDSPHFNGMVTYELSNEQELASRFKVDPVDGIVRTSRPVEDVPQGKLPIKLRLLARDNPEPPQESLSSVAEILINLIEDRHRIVLILKDVPAGRVLDSKDELLRIIQERTGLVSGFEKAESLKVQRNGSQLEADVTGTDFWFYLIEPGTFRIVPSEDARLRSSLFDNRAQNSLLDVISQTLGFQKARIRLPYSMQDLASHNGGQSIGTVASSRASAVASRLASGLIMIALVIAIISAIVIIYQCGSWSSQSRAAKEKLFLQQQQTAVSQMHRSFLTGQQSCPLSGPQTNMMANDGCRQEFRSGYSTLVGSHQHQMRPTSKHLLMKNNMDPNQTSHQHDSHESGHPHQQPNIGAGDKEYETQMLKMSVLFDDCNSLDEQNLNTNCISKNLN